MESLWVQIVQHSSHTTYIILNLWTYSLKISNPASVDIPCLKECCIAALYVSGRLAGGMTPPLACLLYLHKRCMDNDIAGMLYVNWKINIPALPISSMEVALQENLSMICINWSELIFWWNFSLLTPKIEETVSQPLNEWQSKIRNFSSRVELFTISLML